ncbi:MAG TPA: PrsW family glutamic-type intramembrane protease [Candidatus Paceibacterota bacterium]|nr:PrsW family glutamic-type intramembrane protease [Candidatus Paceibacterota bacterium]HRY76892.1 PrsW family glutamic-type intramembrane protease [Candidatus Paceibacterota bacterium]
MNWEGLSKLLFLFLLAVVPSVAWLFYFLKKDGRPEPKRYLLLTFVLGGLVTIIGSQAENVWFRPFVQNNPNSQLGAILFLFFYPFLEEILKFLAARISTIKNRYFRDETNDPMIYMITAALGFAAAENLKVYFSTIFGSGAILTWQGIFNIQFSDTILVNLMATAAIRFLATVLLHAISAAIIGYFWSFTRTCKKKFPALLIAFPAGILLATVLHSVYNYLIMNISEGFVYPLILVILLVISGAIVSRAFRQLKNCRIKK